MNWTDCRVVAFDTETTGLHAFDGDRVVEFGAVELSIGPDGRVDDVREVQFFINPEIPIPRMASKISGITDDDVADAPLFEEQAERVVEVLADAIVVAHNLAFDYNFIRAELRRCGRTWPVTRAEVDTLPLSQRLMPELDSHKLARVCAALNVPLENAHRASHDAEACGRALVELARRRDAPADLEGFVEWADAVAPPPDTPWLRVSDDGYVIFGRGSLAGEPIERHPDRLQWMTLAVERTDGQWKPRFPDSVRRWARRWLRVRGSSKARSNPRSQGPQDWNLDPPLWVARR